MPSRPSPLWRLVTDKLHHRDRPSRTGSLHWSAVDRADGHVKGRRAFGWARMTTPKRRPGHDVIPAPGRRNYRLPLRAAPAHVVVVPGGVNAYASWRADRTRNSVEIRRRRNARRSYGPSKLAGQSRSIAVPPSNTPSKRQEEGVARGRLKMPKFFLTPVASFAQMPEGRLAQHHQMPECGSPRGRHAPQPLPRAGGVTISQRR